MPLLEPCQAPGACGGLCWLYCAPRRGDRIPNQGNLEALSSGARLVRMAHPGQNLKNVAIPEIFPILSRNGETKISVFPSNFESIKILKFNLGPKSFKTAMVEKFSSLCTPSLRPAAPLRYEDRGERAGSHPRPAPWRYPWALRCWVAAPPTAPTPPPTAPVHRASQSACGAPAPPARARQGPGPGQGQARARTARTLWPYGRARIMQEQVAGLWPHISPSWAAWRCGVRAAGCGLRV